MSERRLLICDDEVAFGRLVRTVAEDMGFRAMVTASGPAFIAAYDVFKPTMVILDMLMPEMDGNELVMWLAQRQSTVRLIIITGYAPDCARHAKLLAEFKGLRPATTLNKPAPLAVLRAALADDLADVQAD